MNPETLNFWANVSAVYLMCNVILLMLLPGVLFGFGWWYLRKGRKALAMPFLMAQVYALRVQTATTRITDRIVNVPIQLNAAATQVEVTAKALRQPAGQIKLDDD